MTGWKKKKKFLLEQETGQVYTQKISLIEGYKHYTENNLKQRLEEKKTMG